MIVTEAAVFSYIPADLKPPTDVMRDGQGGVTQTTYDRIVLNTLIELTARLDIEAVDALVRDHALLNDIADLLVSARICRRLRVHQETADSLFAEANMKLRLYFEAVAGVSEGEGEISLVGDDEPELWRIELDSLSTAFLDKVLS